tara:strand:- start:1654 stop:2469 length:816 start_codon:yes stop_codon:yes gene_type:complete
LNFSVLISVYKKESPKYLDDCLKSILINQSIKPNEVVIINDGEITLELKNVIISYKKKFPKIIVNHGYIENKGLGFALNYGLNLCSNELVFRMDADDISDQKRFQMQINFLTKNSDISILGSTIEEFNKIPHDLKRLRKVPISSTEIEKKKLNRNPFNHMTVCFKKSHIKKAGGYSHMPGYEDYYLWLRVLNFYRGHNLDKPLVFARVGNNMLGRRQGFRFFINEIRFQKAIYFDGIQSFLSFITNVILRGLPRLLPKFILKIIYKYFLRN